MPPKSAKSKKEAVKANADNKGDAEAKQEEAKADEGAAVDTPKVEDANPKSDSAAKDETVGKVDSKEEDNDKADKKEESDANEAKKDEVEGEKEEDEGKEKNGEEGVEMKDAAKGKDSKEDGEEGSTKKKKRKKSSASEPREPTVKRERRDRKSANTFTPDDFTRVEKTVKQKHGRGKPLGQLEIVKNAIESAPPTSNELLQVHRLLFAMRGKPPKKEMKANLLKFSGYLPEKDSSLDKDAQEEVDEEEEKKMGARAYKLPVPLIKSILDFLKVDRKGVTTKDDLVDLLLDFLGEPDEEFIVGFKKSTEKKKRKKERAKDEKEDEKGGEEQSGDDYSDIGDERVEEGEPSDEMLRRWVRAYVRCHNMKNATVTSALELATEKFGVDLSSKKQRFKELLTEEM